jgi:hypothetical protein
MQGHDDMVVEGEASKRYGVSYGGQIVGSWDTATGAWQGYRDYEDKIRPVADRKKQYTYTFREGRKEITLEKLRNLVKAEEKARKPASE